MFFSAQQLYNYAQRNTAANYRVQELLGNLDHYGFAPIITPAHAKQALAEVKKSIVAGEAHVLRAHHLDKWFRPWEVVPHLRGFSAPVGDYGIGVEVEMGFTTPENRSFIANLIKDWKYVALDYEGGRNPIEATFQPVLLSKFGGKSQVCRYLKILEANKDKVTAHAPAAEVGTHINVSKGGAPLYCGSRIDTIRNFLRYLSDSQNMKYFGRPPYITYCDSRGSYVEWKMFNSTTDWRVLRRYVNIAVALTDLVVCDVVITYALVLATLAAGYNHPVRLVRTSSAPL